jgi:uncharacterized protein YbaR (Trm112 family)
MLFQTSFTQCLIKKETQSLEIQKEEQQEVQQEVQQEEQEPDIKLIEVDTHSLEDAITIKNPIEQYNEILKKIKQSSLEAQEAYLIAKELKQQFNIEEELPIL